MINVFNALSWLNVIDNCSHLNSEVQQLIRAGCKFGPPDTDVRVILERLRHTACSSGDPLEKAEILLYCAAIGHWRAWWPQAARDAREAVICYDNDDHRRALAFWILGMTEWAMCENHDAYRNWADARKIFEQRKMLFQHFANEKDWYQNRIRQMNIDLAQHPEEIWTWLNWFECSCLRPPTQKVVGCVQTKIRQHAYPSIYVLMQDLQEADRACEGIYEKAEIYLEFGLAIYEMENTHFAIELLRKSVRNFYPGVGPYHKQTIARCMLGALEWRNEVSHRQAVVDWTSSIEEFEILRRWASKDNHQAKMEWYTEHRAILSDALSERLAGHKTKPPRSSDSDDNTPGPNGPKPPPATSDDKRNDLYQDLLSKVLWDRARADRLIEFERKKAPTADRNELIKRAIERWIRDNQ